MSIKPISVPTKTLAQNLAANGTTLYLNNTLSWDGSQLTSSDFGTQAFATLRNSSNTQIEFVEIDPATVTSASTITILKRGLGYDGGQVASAETAYAWSAFDTYVELGADIPQMLAALVEQSGDETVAGKKTFSSVPATSGGDPVDNTDLTQKSYVDSLVNGGAVSNNRVVIAGNAGATVSAGNLVYLDSADGEWKLCDADTAASVENVMLGLAQGAGTDGNAITGGVLIYGLDSNQSGLTNNTKYYASNTAGALSSSAGTKEVSIGISRSTTSILFMPRFDQMLTEDLEDALAGSGGTPSSTNKFITEDGASAVQFRLTEETSSGITAGAAVLLQSDGEATKTATVKNFIATGNYSGFTAMAVDATDSNNVLTTIDLAWLTENKFVFMVKATIANSSYDFAGVGAIGDDGKPAIWSHTNINNNVSVAVAGTGIYRLSDSKFIITGGSGATTMDFAVGSVDANHAITFGTKSSASTENSYLNISRLSDSSFVITYRDAGTDDCYIRAFTVSGVTLTGGSAVQVNTGVDSAMKVLGMSDSKAIIAWTNASAVVTRVVNISGTTITLGANSYNVESTVPTYLFLAKLASDKFLVAYETPSATFVTKACAGTFSGDVITLGTAITIYDGESGSELNGAESFGTNGAVILYDQNSSSKAVYGASFAYVTASGTTLTLANTTVISMYESVNSSATSGNGIAVINGHVVVVTSAGGGLYDQTFVTFKPVFNEVFMGVAKSAPVSNVVPVIKSGRTGSLFSGLTFGKRYLFNQDGTIGEQGVIPGGVAISTTELLID